MTDLLATDKELYREGASHALAGYQMIEELLKTYIGNYFGIVRSLVQDKIYFGFRKQDYKQAPLGRLLQTFDKICADKELVAALRAEVPHRDHIAHQSLLVLFAKSQPTPEDFSKLLEDLTVRNSAIQAVMLQLHAAHKSLITPYSSSKDRA
ncbi:hypothetical protein AB8810_02250 [Xanthomonas sp. NCPPB 3005]|jgi:hypothetical protein|uniref:hypothetical protein n=1 Tax=Xanthomonas sp. NCPPB 3005 TaxID=3240913 RepID=UPI003516521B